MNRIEQHLHAVRRARRDADELDALRQLADQRAKRIETLTAQVDRLMDRNSELEDEIAELRRRKL